MKICETPTTPGFYWYMTHGGHREPVKVVEGIKTAKLYVIRFYCTTHRPIDSHAGKWGPEITEQD